MQIGCDPEFIIRDPDGKPTPAYKFFPPKEQKIKVYDGALFRDGFALEINAFPSTCIALMEENARNVLKSALGRLPEGYTLDAAPTVEVDPEEASGDAAPPDTKTFGCSPATDAYTGQQLIPPIDAVSHPFRYAGGHIHFGLSKSRDPWSLKNYKQHRTRHGYWLFDPTPEELSLCVKWMDLLIGLPLAVIFLNEPAVFARRSYYGMAGEYRRQIYNGRQVRQPVYAGEPEQNYITSSAYGIEYRVPGSEVWRHNALVSMIGRMGRGIIRGLFSFPEWDPSMESDLRRAINTGQGAEALLEKINPGLLRMAQKMRESGDFKTFTYTTAKHEYHSGWAEYLRNTLGMEIPKLPQPLEMDLFGGRG